MEEHEKAIEYMKESLEVYKKLKSRNDPLLAISYNNIGVSLLEIEKYEEAIEYHEESRKRREEQLGKFHEDTAMSYFNIGLCYSKTGGYEQSLEYYKQAIEIYRSLEKEGMAGLACTKAAADCEALGDNEKALAYYEQALALYVSIDDSDADEVRQSIARLKGEPE